ncbi:MAG: sugar ABC transporter permease [Treponema sp.]|nr:sugar ABC transporter permease [Treponema sp.]
MTSLREKKFSYALLVIPALAIYLSVMAFPTITSIVLSLTDYNGGRMLGNSEVGFVGLSNYIWMFTEPTRGFFTAFRNNMLIVAMSVFGQIPLGFALAYLLSRKLVKGTGFFQAMIYLPNVISPVIIGILFRNLVMGPNSLWFELTRFFNPDVQFTLPTYPMAQVLFVMLWMYTGFYMIIFLANLQRIDPSVLEAASIDGASERQIFARIVFPALSGVVVTCAILAIAGSLRSFDLVFVMTGGGPAGSTRVLSLFMFQSAFQGSPNYPLANAISTIIVLISFALILITRGVERLFGGRD